MSEHDVGVPVQFSLQFSLGKQKARLDPVSAFDPVSALSSDHIIFP